MDDDTDVRGSSYIVEHIHYAPLLNNHLLPCTSIDLLYPRLYGDLEMVHEKLYKTWTDSSACLLVSRNPELSTSNELPAQEQERANAEETGVCRRTAGKGKTTCCAVLHCTYSIV